MWKAFEKSVQTVNVKVKSWGIFYFQCSKNIKIPKFLTLTVNDLFEFDVCIAIRELLEPFGVTLITKKTCCNSNNCNNNNNMAQQQQHHQCQDKHLLGLKETFWVENRWKVKTYIIWVTFFGKKTRFLSVTIKFFPSILNWNNLYHHHCSVLKNNCLLSDGFCKY